MLEVKFKKKFLRQFKKLPPGLQDEVESKIELFKNPKNHKMLKVHKLKGSLKKFSSFSVDYSNTIVFTFENKSTITKF